LKKQGKGRGHRTKDGTGSLITIRFILEGENSKRGKTISLKGPGNGYFPTFFPKAPAKQKRLVF
jgi:hypothetical protein